MQLSGYWLKIADRFKRKSGACWKAFNRWKYPSLFLLGVFSSVPALRPGVSGFKDSSDILGGRRVGRIPLENIRKPFLMPDWCIHDEFLGRDGDFHNSFCGITLNGKKALYDLRPVNGWKGRNTVYRQGDTLTYDLDFGSQGTHNIARDWKWLEFFYGFGWQYPFSVILLGLQKLAANWIVFPFFLAVFLSLDLLVGAFLLFRALLRFLKRRR